MTAEYWKRDRQNIGKEEGQLFQKRRKRNIGLIIAEY
jgi:hypothetical protein